jgi:hypothetical protein
MAIGLNAIRKFCESWIRQEFSPSLEIELGLRNALGGGRPRPLIGLFRLQNDPAASLTGLRSIDKIDLKGSSSSKAYRMNLMLLLALTPQSRFASPRRSPEKAISNQ